MNISIIVCTKDRPSDLITFVNSVLQQTAVPYEIIIVDAGSPLMDKMPEFELLRKDIIESGIVLKYISSSPGLTKQRNMGLAKSEGDIILFFDDDVILDYKYIESILNAFVVNPDFFAGMGKITNIELPSCISNSFKKVFLLTTTGHVGEFKRSGFPTFPHLSSQFSSTEVLSGCCMAFRSEVFKTFSFDEFLTGYSYMEDCDISRRVSRNFKVFYEPAARCVHNHSSSSRLSIFDNRKMFLVNHRYFFKRNFSYLGLTGLIAHYWSILGLFLDALVFKRSISAFNGLIAGLKEFRSISSLR